MGSFVPACQGEQQQTPAYRPARMLHIAGWLPACCVDGLLASLWKARRMCECRRVQSAADKEAWLSRSWQEASASTPGQPDGAVYLLTHSSQQNAGGD